MVAIFTVEPVVLEPTDPIFIPPVVPPWMVVVDVLIVEPTFTLEIDKAVLLLPMFKVWEIALELAPI